MDYTASQASATTHTVIDHTYDPLSHLTAADFNTGPFFHYEYDANGNRTQATTPAGTVVSVYNDANRLRNVGGVSYTWDDNGNMTDDGTSSYIYDHANRLVRGIQRATTTCFT